ncbi:hypothetical protein FI667_g17120, partial [Globisporangium splendens]
MVKESGAENYPIRFIKETLSNWRALKARNLRATQLKFATEVNANLLTFRSWLTKSKQIFATANGETIYAERKNFSLAKRQAIECLIQRLRDMDRILLSDVVECIQKQAPELLQGNTYDNRRRISERVIKKALATANGFNKVSANIGAVLRDRCLSVMNATCSCKRKRGSRCQNRSKNVECGDSTCSVGNQCTDRALQDLQCAATIVRESGADGRGLYASESIAKGVFVAEFVAELICESEKKARHSRHRNVYAIGISDTVIINLSRHANNARFKNHSRNQIAKSANELIISECRWVVGVLDAVLDVDLKRPFQGLHEDCFYKVSVQQGSVHVPLLEVHRFSATLRE